MIILKYSNNIQLIGNYWTKYTTKINDYKNLLNIQLI
jgi:hypothetical protein